VILLIVVGLAGIVYGGIAERLRREWPKRWPTTTKTMMALLWPGVIVFAWLLLVVDDGGPDRRVGSTPR
jgi:ABC-type uncharacterized transport system permease subunit